MRMNDYKKMQQDLNQMKKNLQNIQNIEYAKQTKRITMGKGRRAVKKQINRIQHPTATRIADEERTIIIVTIIIVAITFVFSTSIFAKTMVENNEEKQEVVEEKNDDEKIETEEDNKQENNTQNTDDEKEEKIETLENSVLENNENALELENILMENVSVLKSKEYAEEERPIEFETKYIENSKLPEGEEKIEQEGINGLKQVTVIKSFENNELVSENILEEITIENFVPQIVNVGTSKFLGNNKIHLEDTVYLTEEAELSSEAKDDSEKICTILKNLDAILLDVEDDTWAKVEYDGLEGYIKCKYLTSSNVTPGIIDANRRQKIKMTLSKDMPLNKSTDLTLEDYKKILSGNQSDKNKVIEDNAEVFYNMDKNYNMNGVFLASMAIHESAWATSTISKEKKNLFGYGAYDSSPYSSSFSFETYAEGIELLAKVLVKYYINEEGTPIYDDETAKGSYYHGPTVEGVNIRYASDSEWHNKVYKYMEYLYNRL